MPFFIGDGKLHITFVKMGIGDCILITMPNGKTVMIDCGSLGMDTNTFNAEPLELIRQSIFDSWLNNIQRLDVLILSHTDGDHHNKLAPLFKIIVDEPVTFIRTKRKPKKIISTKIPFGKIYTSEQINGYSWETRNFLSKAIVSQDQLRELFFDVSEDGFQIPPQVRSYGNLLKDGKNPDKNDGFVTIPDLELEENPNFDRSEFAVITDNSNRYVKILDGTNSVLGSKVDTGLFILSSGIFETSLQDLRNEGFLFPGDDSPVSPKNTPSIVTMLKYGDKKFLFTADATKFTEQFLVDFFEKEVTDIDFMQVSHHGSAVTSSSEKFLDVIKPKQAVISVGEEVSKHHLPRGLVVDRYLARLPKADVPPHNLIYWRLGEKQEGEIGDTQDDGLYLVTKSINQNLRSTGSESRDINLKF